MTVEAIVHDIVTYVLGAETNAECVKRFKAIINNPKLGAFLKDYSNRKYITDEIIARYKK